MLFMSGTGGRRTAPGPSLISALTAALPAMTKNLALELGADSVLRSRPGLRRHAAIARTRTHPAHPRARTNGGRPNSRNTSRIDRDT